MSSLLPSIILLCVLSAMAGVFAYTSYLQILRIIELRRHKREYPALIRMKGRKHCAEDGSLHTWDKIKLALRGLDPGEYNVCVKCGAVASENGLMLNPPAMEVFLNELANRKKLKNLVEYVQVKKQAGIRTILNKLISRYYNELGTNAAETSKLLERFFFSGIQELDAFYDELNKEIEEKKKDKSG